MSAHNRLIAYLRGKHDVEGRNYCYVEKDDKKIIELTFDLTDYHDIPKFFEVDDIFFKRRLKPIRSNYDEGWCTFEFTYKYINNELYKTTGFTGSRMYGVIAPDGSYYECPYEGHRYLEDDLIERDIIKDSPHYHKTAFEWWGWAVLSGAYSTDVELTFSHQCTEYDYDTKEDKILRENSMTPAQLDTVKRYKESLPDIDFDSPKNRNTTSKEINYNYRWYWVDELTYDNVNDERLRMDLGEMEKEDLKK